MCIRVSLSKSGQKGNKTPRTSEAAGRRAGFFSRNILSVDLHSELTLDSPPLPTTSKTIIRTAPNLHGWPDVGPGFARIHRDTERTGP